MSAYPCIGINKNKISVKVTPADLVLVIKSPFPIYTLT
ncbi:hypothetical protein PARC_b0232 [Pseudoalteromonas arctica A 37-1-2]|uniref:Uncharacterized protein n=1 Tax=Pseudoalteromonas arctica A 37-1-2 TaxID=1117313 RepID=A0A290S8S1_9GAMM|nr:hypothetical protein PARC_b0232 [Pseudoalteromonas arctica A 37-1-2]